MPLARRAVAEGRRPWSAHIWGLDKHGKSRLALSFPRPCYINFDRSEDGLLREMGMGDILRDRIVAPPGELKYPIAKALLTQFEKDLAEAVGLKSEVSTVIIDGGSLALDIITIVTLEESENKNNTYRYAGRNSYVKNLFNTLNASGMYVVWTSKAKPLWIGNTRVAGEYVPDCHDDIPFMVDVNLQAKAEPAVPMGLNFYAKIGMNGFNPMLTGMVVKDPKFEMLDNLMFAVVEHPAADPFPAPAAEHPEGPDAS